MDWASELECLPASAGVGATGDTIGATTAESSTTTTRTSRTAGRSSTAIVFIRADRTSITAPIHVTEVLLGIRDFTGPTIRTHRQEGTLALSVGSAMAGSREVTQPEGIPALAASMVGAVASMVGAVASTVGAAEATDSLHEEITHETRNDEHD